MNYYVYTHVRLDTNTIFYIGKGKICNKQTYKGKYRRAYNKKGRNKFWKNITNFIEYKVIIKREFISEKAALLYEEYLISKYRLRKNGGSLTNVKESDTTYSETMNKGYSDNLKRIKIYQYTLNGDFVKEWDSISDAAKYIKCTITSLSASLGKIKNRKCYQTRGYMWRLFKELKIEPLLRPSTSKKVYQYDKKDNFIREWESSRIASDTLNISYTSIRNCLSGLSNSSAGFKWNYNKIHHSTKTKV